MRFIPPARIISRKKLSGGQGLLEYAIIIALVVLAAILALRLAGVSINEMYCGLMGDITKSAQCATYCQDAFDGNLSGWTNASGGGWRVVNGQLCTAPPYGEGRLFNNCSQSNPDMPADYTITLDIATLTAGNGYGVFFRMQSFSPASGYTFQYDPGLNGFAFRRWTNGSESAPIARVNFPPGFSVYNAPHTVKIVVKGNTFTAYLDDTLALSATDSMYPRGGVGLRRWDNSDACFGSFAIGPVE